VVGTKKLSFVNEPVVCRPEEAIDCFLRTKMDVLVLGDTLIRR
jgi:carbamoyltransferase